MDLLFIITSLLPLPQAGGIVVEIPHSWVSEQSRPSCPVRPSHVSSLLGRPTGVTVSYCSTVYSHRGLGLGFQWEGPGKIYSLGARLGHEEMGVLSLVTPPAARPILWLLALRFATPETLRRVSWSAWGLRYTWCPEWR